MHALRLSCAPATPRPLPWVKRASTRCPGPEGCASPGRTHRPARVALDPAYGVEGPRALAVIDEGWCISCTLCIQACPVDCIIGTNKHLHTVIESQCTGCELCLPVCPVDCITLVPAHPEPVPTGWAAWSPEQADEARARHTFRATRIARAKADNDVRLLAKGEHKLQDLAAASRAHRPGALDHKAWRQSRPPWPAPERAGGQS